MQKKHWIHTALSLSVVWALVGCSGGASSSSTPKSAGYDMTVERGPVLFATLQDSQGELATEVGGGHYRFAQPPVFPVIATGGIIDLDRDGKVSEGDINNTIVLKALDGKAVTLVSTLAANAQNRRWLQENLGLSEERIANTPPSQNRDIAAISDAIYAFCIENGINDPSKIQPEALEAMRDTITNRIEQYHSSNAPVANLENELIQTLHIPRLNHEEAQKISANPHNILASLPNHDDDDDHNGSEPTHPTIEEHNAQEMYAFAEDKMNQHEEEGDEEDKRWGARH